MIYRPYFPSLVDLAGLKVLFLAKSDAKWFREVATKLPSEVLQRMLDDRKRKFVTFSISFLTDRGQKVRSFSFGKRLSMKQVCCFDLRFSSRLSQLRGCFEISAEFKDKYILRIPKHQSCLPVIMSNDIECSKEKNKYYSFEIEKELLFYPLSFSFRSSKLWEVFFDFPDRSFDLKLEKKNCCGDCFLILDDEE